MTHDDSPQRSTPTSADAPAQPGSAVDLIEAPARDLRVGDQLLRLGGVGFAQFRDPDATAILVADVRPPEDPHDTEEVVEILTSAGTMYSRANAPALVNRATPPQDATILLISRRRSLHARLTKLGYPVVRRTVRDGESAPVIDPAEWFAAPLIVIDGYLAQPTLRELVANPALADRDQIVMVGDDPDDARVFARQSVARARALFVLPYDESGLRDLFQAAISPDMDSSPYFGILTEAPHPRG